MATWEELGAVQTATTSTTKTFLLRGIPIGSLAGFQYTQWEEIREQPAAGSQLQMADGPTIKYTPQILRGQGARG